MLMLLIKRNASLVPIEVRLHRRLKLSSMIGPLKAIESSFGTYTDRKLDLAMIYITCEINSEKKPKKQQDGFAVKLSVDVNPMT